VTSTSKIIKRFTVVIHPQAGNRQSEEEILCSRCADQPHQNLFGTLVQAGEDKPRRLRPWPDQAPADTVGNEKGIHAVVGDPTAEHLEGAQDQQWQEQPREQAEAQQSPTIVEVIEIRRLQRGVIIPVNAGEAEPIWTLSVIADLQPHWLNP